ncbi:hypothetical protein [Streptomyces adustus]|uniref:hypothetical protein n=1 Tax=Streptomyces adustus TaxID=1609272 RepID=UPI0012E05FCB|nr:hypothetical protein [Streptomyces adustus]
MADLLRQHGPPVLSAWNTALVEAVTTLPRIVIADLFGISACTAAETWSKYASGRWTH